MWILLPVLGCTPALHRVDGDIVRDIAFSGNGGAYSGHNTLQLRQQMVQKETSLGLGIWPLMYLVDPVAYRSEQLIRDAYRLEVWYSHQGWFDARVLGWEILQIHPQGPHRAGVVDLRGQVDPGPRSVVRKLRVEGLDKSLEGLRNAVLRAAPAQEGEPFTLEGVELTAAALERKLRNSARAYAEVELEVAAFPETQQVDVTLRVEPGVVSRFGPVSVEGTETVPEVLVRQRIERVLSEGDRYELQLLGDVQRRLFEMGTFSLVTVEPDLSEPDRADVPIRVRVIESKLWTLRMGGGGTYDSFLPQVRATANLRQANLAHQLLRAELGIWAGAALAANAEAASSVRLFDREYSAIPTGGVDLSLSYPRLFAQRGALDLHGSVEQDVYAGLWVYRRPQIDLNLSYQDLKDKLQLRVGPHFEQYTFLVDYLGTNEQIRVAQARLFGLDDEDVADDQRELQYQLTALDQLLTLDYRDDPLRTTRGTYYSLSFREALPLSPMGYGFLRGAAEVRAFSPIRVEGSGSAYPITLAGKLRATAILPVGATDTIPLPERSFLGGSTSLRGFRSNQVGPYTTLCTYQSVPQDDGTVADQVTRYHLPDGGNLSAEGSLELRYQWKYGVTWALFGDLGALGSGLGQLGAESVRGSVGVGSRYDTSVGALRFDVSLRPLYAEDDGPRRYSFCAPGDRVPRVSDFVGTLDQIVDLERPSWAIVFFITIGESL
ncbi:MAG TPA: hypothetical protein ENK18_09325 [Deltaproteobacteria bacterium]|nr:hypothetical protein [Deltaproteobacteria bacterium]